MSKTFQENISTVSERIDKVLIDKGLIKEDGRPNYAEAERKCDIKGTVLSKAAQRQGGLSDYNKEKFLRTFHVNPAWFDTGKGDIFTENPTLVTNSTGNTQTDGKVNLDEVHPDYFYVPKTMVQGEYRLELISQIEARREEWKELLKAKNDLINQLKEEIRELKEENKAMKGSKALIPAKQTQ